MEKGGCAVPMCPSGPSASQNQTKPLPPLAETPPAWTHQAADAPLGAAANAQAPIAVDPIPKPLGILLSLGALVVAGLSIAAIWLDVVTFSNSVRTSGYSARDFLHADTPGALNHLWLGLVVAAVGSAVAGLVLAVATLQSSRIPKLNLVALVAGSLGLSGLVWFICAALIDALEFNSIGIHIRPAAEWWLGFGLAFAMLVFNVLLSIYLVRFYTNSPERLPRPLWVGASLRGRATRSEWWLVYVLDWVPAAILLVIARVISWPMYAATGSLFIVINVTIDVCITGKRLHDRGYSANYYLFSLIPIFGWIWLLVQCGFLAGRSSSNQWGAPRAPNP